MTRTKLLAVVPLLCPGSFLFAQQAIQQPAQQPAEDAARRAALERAVAELPTGPTAVGALQGSAAPTAPTLRLVDLSLDLMTAAGWSSEPDDVLADLQGGGHDPKKRGFTLQQAELSMVGAVDPYFTGHLHLVALLDPDEGETNVELEEAYLRSLALPGGLQLKAGTYLTEFGRINDRHPHQWDFQDQPVIHTRVFGADGMRGPGARLSWLLPTEHYVEVIAGVQNANGETMTSFLANDEVYEERPIGGRAFVERPTRSAADLVYTGRAMTTFALGDDENLDLGASAVFGPNATGEGADTMIYGADFAFVWRPEHGERGWPFLKVQGEYVARAFDAAAQVDDTDPMAPVTVPGATLRDQGCYLQGLYGFTPGWTLGLRLDWAGGSGDSYLRDSQQFGRELDPYRSDRVRLTPMLAYHPSEFSRIRLQYDYDHADDLDRDAHSVWLGFEILIGAHPPHSY
ncbi:MAG: hypothetical protein H6838_06900 [Planctomycetes bacterium]|nr:hypothetical protein [Planctomycetota bacterium]MCB9885202.1 hypothetical protein [Planctomycetota bacterium]